MASSVQKFRFRSHDTVGGADAESDHAFLKRCFVETGDLDILLDRADYRRIVLGRTGAGKTALISHLADMGTNRVLNVKPESLALSYISNCTILQFVEGLGVNLDTFFKLLWRHVFTVEVIKAHFHLDGPQSMGGVVAWLKNVFDDKKRQHEKALSYLERWGSRFWEQTDYRIQELTTKLERELQASISTAIPSFPAKLKGGADLTREEKATIVERARFVVNQVQIQELSYVLELLDEILDDPQEPYYIVIDNLDENWIEERLRYPLVRAPIETVRDFRRVRNAKVVVALRRDLIDRVIKLSRSAGFQEEKYESLYLELNWTKSQLIEVLDKRISRLVKRSYTTQAASHKDLLPPSVDGKPTIDYMLERTLMRPRDIIMFFNACIRNAVNNPQVTARMLREAEGEYSRGRLRSLADEWIGDYPDLMDLTVLLKNRSERFRVSELTDDACLDVAIRLLSVRGRKDAQLATLLRRVDADPANIREFRNWAVACFYRVGLIGLKLEAYDAVAWSMSGRRSISTSEITGDARAMVHPCYWRSLGIKPERQPGKRRTRARRH